MRHVHWIAAACTAALAACGGGGSDDSGATALATETAQGYAADATTMPVSAASGAEAAVGALEAGLAMAAQTSADRARVQAVMQPGGSAQCLRGGTVSWAVSGGALIGNWQLDAGETYEVSFDGCITGDNGPTIDGTLSLLVNARASGTLDVTVTATALRFAQGPLQYTLDGSWREQRTSVTTPVGGTQFSGRISSSGLTLDSTTGLRHAHYTLSALDWTVARTYDAAGLLTARTHQGTLQLAASTPRRPDATLSITTIGATTVGSDGLVSAGSFTVRTGHDTITSTHADGSVTLTLDLGNDGTIDRTWTLARPNYIDSAG